MGYNTAVLVLNDRLNEIETDPYFGRSLARAIREFNARSRQPYLTGQTTIISSAHADMLQLISIGANTGRLIGIGHWTMNERELITHLYSDLTKSPHTRTNLK